MSDHDALLNAIISNPEEDTPRLMFADWLQENRQERRAQFIRQQIAAARAEPFSPESRAAGTAAGQLLGDSYGEWVGPIRPWVRHAAFHRGFVEHAVVDTIDFPGHAAELFAAAPIRSMRLMRPAEQRQSSLEPFFETPQLERLTRLALSNLYVSPVELDPLPSCPRLRNLTDLSLGQTPIIPDWLEWLLEESALPALAGLDLADLSHLGPRLAELLPRIDHRRILRLDLSRVVFTSEGIQRALGSRCLREVEELRLAWLTGTNRLGALRHLDLGWVIPWDRLRLLDLDGQGVGNSGVEEIVRELQSRPGEAPLRWLGLRNNGIGPDAVRVLTHSASKLRLYHLDLRGNGLKPSQIAALQLRFPEATIQS